MSDKIVEDIYDGLKKSRSGIALLVVCGLFILTFSLWVTFPDSIKEKIVLKLFIESDKNKEQQTETIEAPSSALTETVTQPADNNKTIAPNAQSVESSNVKEKQEKNIIQPTSNIKVDEPTIITKKQPQVITQENSTESLKSLISKIKSSTSKDEKKKLKIQARAIISSDLNFITLRHYENEESSEFKFVSYDPETNILEIDEHFENNSKAFCNPSCPAFSGRLTIYLSKADRVNAYPDSSQFELDCWFSAQYQSNKCIEYEVKKSTCDNMRCERASDQIITFFATDAKSKKFKNALRTIIYEIDGRPAH